MTVPQLRIKFPPLGVPIQVARASPAAASHAGVLAGNGAPGSVRTPNPVAPVLLQSSAPAAHSTEVFPMVMSLKVQVPSGAVAPVALQAALPGEVAWAASSLYNT